MKEGDYVYPKSCLEIKFRGMKTSGMYKIEPRQGHIISVYCNMNSLNGGWTLLTTFASKNGWVDSSGISSIEMRAAVSGNALVEDYSVLKYADDIKNLNPGEVIVISSCCKIK